MTSHGHRAAEGCEGGGTGPEPGSNERLGEIAGRPGGPADARQREAFDELFRRLWRASVEWARAAGAGSQELAEDAATEAWFRAWRYRHRFDPSRAGYSTWLSAIVRNETMDLLRSESRQPAGSRREDPQRLEELPGPVSDGDLVALAWLWEAFEQLRAVRPEHAKVLRLKALGFPDARIAEACGLRRVGTVASRLSRAKTFLAERLAERGVVYVAGRPDAELVERGLTVLCRTGEGGFYGVESDRLRILPDGRSPGAPWTPVGKGFRVTIWSADPGRAAGSCGRDGLKDCAG